MEWLYKKDIQYSPAELTNVVGHKVVHFLLYHCQYNLLVLLQAQVKQYIAKKNNGDMLILSKNSDRITQEKWAKCVRHASHFKKVVITLSSVQDTSQWNP